MRTLLSAIALVAGVAATTVPAQALDAVGEGRRAWLKFNCYGCHGGNGAGGMGPNVQHAEAGDVNEAMWGDAREKGMRSFAGTGATATDAANIAKYLATIGTAREPKWLDWWKATPGQ
jgi:mono/diheme cytochrome c family protein